MKTLAILLSVLAASLSAAGCNTVHGIGQDISATGEVIQKAVK